MMVPWNFESHTDIKKELSVQQSQCFQLQGLLPPHIIQWGLTAVLQVCASPTRTGVQGYLKSEIYVVICLVNQLCSKACEGTFSGEKMLKGKNFKHLLRKINKNISSVQLLSHVWLFSTPWTAACQAFLSIANSQNLLIPVHQPWAPCLMHRIWTADLFHIWWYTCFNTILSNHPTLTSHRVQKSVLYICVSFAVSHIGSLLPSF